MRIRYTIRFKNKLTIDDHWPIPFQGGNCRVLEEDGLASALEIVLINQPLSIAPTIEKLAEGPVKLSITAHDHFLPLIQRHLDEATAFLQCFHDIELETDEIEAHYEAEFPEDKKQILVSSMKSGKYRPATPVAFNMLTRAVMAAEIGPGPRFEATLLATARRALSNQQFIDSFRYAFLLIESIYGGGQFRSGALKDALRGHAEFKALVSEAIRSMALMAPKHPSATATLLSKSPSADEVIGHLVEMRGFYFHGNIKRPNAWRPEQQESADAIAMLTITIAQAICSRAAAPMFDAALEQKHFDSAMKAGAKIVYQIDFGFREPQEEFLRQGQLNVTTPGTKATAKLAVGSLKVFVQHFEENYPVANLDHVVCSVKDTGERVFDLKLYISK